MKTRLEHLQKDRNYAAILFCIHLAFCIGLGSKISAAEFTKTRIMMGTSVSISVNSKSEQSIRAVGLAFQEVERVEELLSTYKSDSYISRLNRVGFLANPPIELRQVVVRSLHYSCISKGAFDITVKPVLDLYKRCFELQKRVPATSELRGVMALVDFRNVIVINDYILIRKHGARITTDAIAKGYIIDQAIRVLKNNGIRSAMVNIGGDLRAMGTKSNNEAWIVALQNPRRKAEHLAIIAVNDRAVATSGDYERYFVAEKQVHHIVDPCTGLSATSTISATVIANTAMDADALATAVFVMGPERGMNLVESLPEVEALIITNRRQLMKSSGFSTISICPEDHIESVSN